MATKSRELQYVCMHPLAANPLSALEVDMVTTVLLTDNVASPPLLCPRWLPLRKSNKFSNLLPQANRLPSQALQVHRVPSPAKLAEWLRELQLKRSSIASATRSRAPPSVCITPLVASPALLSDITGTDQSV